MNTPIQIKDSDYEKILLKAQLPVMLEFWQQGCGPCQMYDPVLDEMASRYADRLLIAKLDVDANNQVAQQNSVLGAPTIFFINHGKLVHRINGYLDIKELKKQVADFVK